MESPIYPALYLLQTDLVRLKISLSCGTNLKVPSIVKAYSRPPRNLKQEKNTILVFKFELTIIAVKYD